MRWRTDTDSGSPAFEPDPATMTDGQLADQLAAETGSFYEEGVHGTTDRVVRCGDCGHRVERRR